MPDVEEIAKDELESKPAGSKKLIFIIAGAIVVLVGVAAALFFTGVLSHKKTTASEAKVEIKVPEKTAKKTFALKEFIVNLADADAARYLKTSIELEVANEEIQKACEANQASIRNSVVELLSSKTYAQIRDVKGKTRLRQEVIVRLNEILGTNGISQVYFTDFIVQ